MFQDYVNYLGVLIDKNLSRLYHQKKVANNFKTIQWSAK